MLLNYFAPGRHLMLDVSVAMVLRESATTRATAPLPGWAALAAEKTKFREDADRRAHEGAHGRLSRFTLVPFVMEESGRFGLQALAFLRDFNGWARRQRLESGVVSYASQQVVWRQELTASLHFALAADLREALCDSHLTFSRSPQAHTA